MEITNGVGNRNKAKVDENFRLHVQSVTESEAVHSAEIGEAFNLNTGNVSYSADGTLLYIKNNEDRDLIIEAIALGFGDGVTYSDAPYITLSANPTGGDLISDATDVDMNQNRNFGSSRVLIADAFKGKSSGTLTGGDDVAILQCSKTGRSFFSINFVIPKGSSLGISLDLNAASGSCNIYCAAIVHLKDPASI